MKFLDDDIPTLAMVLALVGFFFAGYMAGHRNAREVTVPLVRVDHGGTPMKVQCLAVPDTDPR